MDIVYLIIGLAFLLISGNYLVSGAVSIAKHFKIPSFIVGITIISMGTSAPELLVSVQAALNGSPDIAIGNIIGSNISNIALVLAFTCIVCSIRVKKATIIFDWTVMFLSSIVFFIFAHDLIISRIEGFIFIALLFAFIFGSIIRSRNHIEKEPNEKLKPKFSIFVSIIILLLSFGGLILGSKLLVNSASSLALSLGISERIVSITIIAFGTSVPELTTSIIAALKKETDISVGNLIGSNIFNVLAILGITASIKPINISPSILNFDIPCMLGILLLLFMLMLPIKKSILNYWKGIILLICYFTYFYFVVN